MARDFRQLHNLKRATIATIPYDDIKGSMVEVTCFDRNDHAFDRQYFSTEDKAVRWLERLGYGDELGEDL